MLYLEETEGVYKPPTKEQWLTVKYMELLRKEWELNKITESEPTVLFKEQI